MDAEAYSLVQRSVKQLLRIDLTYYKDEQMKRRLDSWLVRMNVPSWPEYLRAIQNNPVELARFRDYLTINVTEFFRDPDRWKALREQVLPGLLSEARGRGLRVWSAGCSIGVEPYTLAMLLDEVAPGWNHTILATDLDRGVLQKARARGPYREDEMRNLTLEQRQKYMSEVGGVYWVRENLGQRVRFAEGDLLQDRFENNFDLIVCRNVVIYFTNDAKTTLYRKFQQALRPGGFLFLGGTEIISQPGELGLESHLISFYRRLPAFPGSVRA
jgi:chemotaxis protein methyltransferase CheR